MENNKEFTVIETQEQLDEIVKKRLDRQEKDIKKSYDGWTSPDDLNTLNEKHKKEIEELTNNHAKELEKYQDFEKQIKEKDDEIAAYKVSNLKNNIAREEGLPYEAIEFLQGSTEDDIKESAKRLATFSSKNVHTAPTKDREGSQEDSYTASLKETLAKLGQK